MRLRYTHPETGRELAIEITPHFAGCARFYTFRLLDGVPGRARGGEYRFYLDALRAALEAARQECRKPVH